MAQDSRPQAHKDDQNQDYPKHVKKGQILEEFKEYHEVQNIIAGLGEAYKQLVLTEMAYERFLFIVDQYQEQPHLLDPHLEPMLNQLLNIVKNPESDMKLIHLAFKFLYLITKTRGYKVIVRLMPHEVADLEPVLTLLGKQDLKDFETWETRYMLLLWLSIVSMIPFDMVRLDSNLRTEGSEVKQPIMERIIQAGQKYLFVSDKSRDAAAYMLSRFMTRPDVKKEKLPQFLDWSLQTIHKADIDTMPGMITVSGALNALALLFKQGKREDLLEYGSVVLKEVNSASLAKSGNTLLRKLHIKLTQRIGLIFLKAKIAAWRYQRGSRSLSDNLATQKTENTDCNKTLAPEDEEIDYDIPDEIENVIESLLIGLRDKDTIVRWSAAKGVGRVTGRLPKDLADEVVGSIMELFTITETDAAWHGGCLALAELGRRGLLLPQRLPDVVPVILRALTYDEKRGNYSVGSHVRDAACYVCWAFARAYDPQEIKPHVQNIANALVIASVFDREVNVRRAAAAAFQEHVGRQGQFPHGIDILTTCDYFAVGNKTTCYLELSMFVAQFPEYTIPLIDHLAEVKISHWDWNIRSLTSRALHRLTEKAPEYMANKILPMLLSKMTDMDLYLRHGSIITSAEIVHALSKLAAVQGKSVTELIKEEDVNALRGITSKLQGAELFKGMGGELMRKGVCKLIKKMSLAQMPFHEDEVIGVWQDLIEDCLQHMEKDVQNVSMDSIPAFFTEYYKTESGEAKPEIQDKVLTRFLKECKSSAENIRVGYTQALGMFPAFFIQGQLDSVLRCLMEAAVARENESKWAEARSAAVMALAKICCTVGVKLSGPHTHYICEKNISDVYKTFFKALKDYTLDSRGDVGAWVRESSMGGLMDVTSMLMQKEPTLVTSEMTQSLFLHFVQQASEKIDRTRECAGEAFSFLLYHSPELPGVPHKEQLLELFPRDVTLNMNWTVPAVTFPYITQLLSLEQYRYHVLLGLTVSVGGLTESLVKHSSSSLLSYLHRISEKPEEMDNFSQALLQVFKDYLKVDRVSLPMFKMLDQLLANGCFECYVESDRFDFAGQLLNLSKQEVTKSGDPQKLLASIDVFCGLLQFKAVKNKCLTQLLLFMCHKYPIVRRTVANKLYEAIVTYDDVVSDEALDEVTIILSETQWDEPVSKVKPLRNTLCDLFGVPRPVPKAKTPAADGDS